MRTKLDQSDVPISYAIAQARIRKRKWEATHERAKEVFGERKKPKREIEREWPRSVRTLFSRLRSDHSRELKHHQYRIEIADDPFCTCGEIENIENLLCYCPILDSIRRSVFGEPVKMSHMVTEPEKLHWGGECVDFWQMSFNGSHIERGVDFGYRIT